MRFSFRLTKKKAAVCVPSEPAYFFPVRQGFGLDFSDASLKAVELTQKNGKYFLQAHSFVELPQNVIYRGEVKDGAALKKAIEQLLKNARPRPIVNKFVVASFPEVSVYLRPFEFPAALSEKQVRDAIPYEAESELPINLSDMYTDIDFHRSRDNGHHVVFTAAPRLMVDIYVNILREAGLKPIVFDLDSPALVRSLMQPSDDPLVILDIGAWSSTITIIEREMVHGYVSVPIGGSHITQIMSEILQVAASEAEAVKKEKGIFTPLGEKKNILEDKLALLVAEIIKAAKYHEQHTGRTVKQLVVSGGTALAADFIEYLRSKTGYGVMPGDPLANNKLGYSEGYSAADKADFADHKEAFASTIGLAVRGTGKNITKSGLNLLPAKIRLSYENWPYQLSIGLSTLLMVFVMLVLSAGTIRWFVLIYSRDQLANFEQNVFKSSFPVVEFDRVKIEIKAVNQELGVLKSFEAKRVNLSLALDNLVKNIPGSIKITDLFITSPASAADPAVTQIKGVAATRNDMLNFENYLRGREDVLNVDSPLSNMDRALNAPFMLTVTIKVAHDDYAQNND